MPPPVIDASTLAAARDWRDLDAVVVRAGDLKHRGLLPCALKYALWAVRQGGAIVVEAGARESEAFLPYEINPNLVRQWTFKFLGRDVALQSIDADGRLTLVRTSAPPPPGWSAGVMFSGNDAEIPALRQCLDGMLLQPELVGGQVVVCGPKRDIGFLADFPGVTYLEYEAPPGLRFAITAKKNALIRALKGPRVAIFHARIVLDDGALAKVPREFDITSPNTVTLSGKRVIPYLSLCSASVVEPGRTPDRPTWTMRHATAGDPLFLHERGGLFVDGAAFFAMKRVHDDCPLNDDIAWREGEDLEWCLRAFQNGWLIDLAPECRAVSQTSKLRDPPDLGPLTPFAARAIAGLKARAASFRRR